MLANLLGTDSGAPSIMPGLDPKNPFADAQRGLLQAVGIADLAACLVTMTGTWLTRREMPKTLRRCMDIPQARLSTACLASVLTFRALLTVAIAPWFGFMMAFDHQRQHEGVQMFLMVSYITFSGYFVWVLVWILMYAVDESRALEQRLREQDKEERMDLLRQAHLAGYPSSTETPGMIMEASPVLFGCLPLERTVTVYIAIVCAACIWFFVRIFFFDGSGGGWAFFTRLPNVNVTFWLEFFLYILTVLFSFFVLHFLVVRREEAEMESPLRARKRLTLMLLLYFVVSILRFALFIPVTGMAIVSEDICGLFSHALDDLSLTGYMSPLHCTSGDSMTLLVVLAIILLDGYLIYGVLQLWQTVRAEYTIGCQAEAALKANSDFLIKGPIMGGWGGLGPRRGYGSADPRLSMRVA